MNSKISTLAGMTLAAMGVVHFLGCVAAEDSLPGNEAAVGEAELAASSSDYPGPCSNEQTVPGTPQYLSADYHGVNPDARVITMPDVGRIRAGISCVGTAFIILRIGPDSAVCQALGKCTQGDLSTLTPSDISYLQSYYPGQVPLYHVCSKHGFGWYDAVGVAPGTYLAVANSGSALWGFFEGHGTMDTYAYYGNGGAYQPVNCSPPVVCGDGICNYYGESCYTCEADCGICYPDPDPSGGGCLLPGCGVEQQAE
jgi:hypothetical protein